MTLGFLADHPECRPTLAAWYLREWPGLFDDAFTPHHEMDGAMNREQLDCTLLGFVDGRLAASAALLTTDVLPLPEYSPWLGTVVVDPALRSRGLGREITLAALSLACRIGITTLHLWTPHHRAFYEKLGWEFVRNYTLRDHMVSILRISLL
ncbi:MAG: GNAT family N-acetyltransferase [Chthoniobacterales bacterium]